MKKLIFLVSLTMGSLSFAGGGGTGENDGLCNPTFGQGELTLQLALERASAFSEQMKNQGYTLDETTTNGSPCAMFLIYKKPGAQLRTEIIVVQQRDGLDLSGPYLIR